MARAAIDSSTLSERVYQHIRAEILENRIGPGEPLHEVTLAVRLGVSRAPVRAAIQRLTSERLAEARPRRPAVAAPLSPQAFLNLYQVREALEVLAIRLAVPRFTDVQLRGLRRLHAQAARAGARRDIEGLFAANARFHQAIVAASGNDRLVSLYNQLRDEMARYRARSLTLRGGWTRSLQEHAAVLAAVETRDSAGAARLLSRHIRIPQEILKHAAGPESGAKPAGPERRRAPKRATGGSR